MTATDELRRLLNERGVEHYDHNPNPEYSTPYSTRDTEWSNSAKRNVLYQEWPNGTTRLGASNVSPAQVIAATLAPGTCHNTQSDFDFMCSECGKCVDNGRVLGFNFCPRCGRRIVEVDVEEDE